MKFHRHAGVAMLTAALLVPVGAATASTSDQTQTTAHPGHGKTKPKAVKCVKSASKDYREAKLAARQGKKADYRNAQRAWRKATVEERDARDLALAKASTDEERAAARVAYREATSGDRADRKMSRVAARKEFRAKMKTAGMDFRDAKKECRK